MKICKLKFLPEKMKKEIRNVTRNVIISKDFKTDRAFTDIY